MGYVIAGQSGDQTSRTFDRLTVIPVVSAFIAVAIGFLVLLGWEFNIDLFKRIIPRYAAVNPITAICIILSGAAIALSHYSRRRLAFVAAMVITTISLIKIVDLVTGGRPVDQIFFPSLLNGDSGSLPNRMAPNSAVALLLSGLSLALVQSDRPRLRLFSQFAAAWVLLIATFALLGYIFELTGLRGIASYIPMALPTALALTIVGMGLLSLSRESGLMLLLGDKGPAGSICRIILPLVVPIPVIAGALRLWGEKLGYYNEETGITLQIMSNVVIISALLLSSMLALYRSDQVRKTRERDLKNSEQLNRLIASANPDCISLLDEEGNFLFANDALVHAHGLKDASELVGRSWGYKLEFDSRAERDAAFAAARNGGTGRFTLRLPNVNDEPRWFDTLISRVPPDDRSAFYFLAMSRDVTEKREIEDQVRWKATHDDLTELPNRALFQVQLDRMFENAAQDGFVLLLLDVDNFKLVNDTLGHDAGDSLLCAVAQRVAYSVRQGDFVARLAGDEFAVIVRGVRTEAAAIAVAERIFESFREPWNHNGRLADCRVSIGASIAPKHGIGPTELLKNADIALYVAKTRGKGQMAVFQPEMRAAIQTRSKQIAQARLALREDLIVPYYQPIVQLDAGRISGFEALLRWRHPRRGVQMPVTIQAAFEDLELAGEITERMVCHALWDMSHWLDQGLEFGYVAINVTAADLRQGDFADRLIARLDSQSIPRSCLQVEVTETVFLGRGADYVERALQTLNANGIRVALDDFGTGYASLSHLKQFPVDIVKIDRTFLQDFNQDPQNDAIINTVISLGNSLNIGVIAEGIETIEQERHLLSRGCAYGQGYFYGRAMPASRIPRLIKNLHQRDRKAA